MHDNKHGTKMKDPSPSYYRLLLLLVLYHINNFCLVECAPAPLVPVPTSRKTSLQYNGFEKKGRDDHNHIAMYASSSYRCGGNGNVIVEETKSFSSSAIMEGLKNSLASGLAAVCAKSVLAPFDTIKTVQQEYIAETSSLSLTEAFKMITSRKGGFLNLYAGLGVAAIGSMPSVGLYFGLYSYSKRKLNEGLFSNASPSDQLIKTLTIAVSAAFGNTVASVSRVPYEVVKQKIQVDIYPNTFVALREMIFNAEANQSVLRQFFPKGGISSQMIRDVPYAILTLLSYEYLRENFVNAAPSSSSSSNNKKSSKPEKWKDLVAGGMAGGIGTYLTNPLDVIKTRLQTGNALKYSGVWDCGYTILKEEGPKAFMKGSVPRLIHKIPANAVFFLSYEFFRRLLKVEQVTNNDSKKDGGK